MRRLLIERKQQRETCVLGELTMFDDNANVLGVFKTLEEDIESNQRGQDHRVPAGRYKCFWHEASRFKDSISKIMGRTQDPLGIYNDEVPRDRYILIHQGNTHKDTQGCILLGEEYGNDGESVVKSRDAIKRFYTLLDYHNSKQISVEIVNRLS